MRSARIVSAALRDGDLHTSEAEAAIPDELRPPMQPPAWLQEAMPAEAPGTLSKDETAAVLACILQLNKIPAGKADLPADRAVLDRIRITETFRRSDASINELM